LRFPSSQGRHLFSPSLVQISVPQDSQHFMVFSPIDKGALNFTLMPRKLALVLNFTLCYDIVRRFDICEDASAFMPMLRDAVRILSATSHIMFPRDNAYNNNFPGARPILARRSYDFRLADKRGEVSASIPSSIRNSYHVIFSR
jgi:hypothetical protein